MCKHGNMRYEANSKVNDSVVESQNSCDVDEGVKPCCGKSTPHSDAVDLNTFLQRESKRVARKPCIYLCSSMFLSLLLSVIGLVIGEFAIEVENEGWWSRGTPESDKNRQANLVSKQKYNLAYNETAWDILMNPDIDHPGYEAILYDPPFLPDAMNDALKEGNSAEPLLESPGHRTLSKMHRLLVKKVKEAEERRKLLPESSKSVLAGCKLGFYSELSPANLWPMWRIPKKEYKISDERSILDADILEAICNAEENTQSFLEEEGLCNTGRGCESGKCIPPYSAVLYARLLVDGALDASADGSFSMNCKTLSEAWTSDLQDYVRKNWIEEIKDLKILLSPSFGESERTEPQFTYGYYPALVQSDFDINGGRSQITSSVFDTASTTDADEMYGLIDNFDRAKDKKNVLEGAYDTGYEGFATIKTDMLVTYDMTLALASAVVISIAIMLHTQSPLITSLGLLQITLSFPLSYFIYALVLGYEYFPFLNFIGVFVVFALGAGDIFVSYDKWTNYRKNNPSKSTEYIAALALPESLGAMFLTTITTALAFFATVVCPVAPIKMFGIFCGLLILLDYVLTVFFIFPGLCIYDQALIKHTAGEQKDRFFWMGCIGCGTYFTCCSKTAVYDDVVVANCISKHHAGGTEVKEATTKTEKYNSVQRLMLDLSIKLHRVRWILLVICFVAFGFAVWFALKLSLPDTSEVRLLKPGMEYEKAYQWRKDLLAVKLDDLSGSISSVIFGLNPADTGVQTNPADGTSLELDQKFDPSSVEAQIYMRDFCESLYEEDFARSPRENFTCAINEFDQWLRSQALSKVPNIVYSTICGSPDGVPVATDKFHKCISTWALQTQNFDVISRESVVKYVRIPFRTKVIFSDPPEVLEEQWKSINAWLTASNEGAPEGVNNAFFTSLTFHWFDTNNSLQKSAISSAGISLAFSAAIILLSSYSLLLTLFSTVTIFFILVSVTSLLVVMGWTLGFLESICFSILIGVSVDFVIHFTHAYVHKKGELPREERTRYAMVTMGPSILTTAGTTFFSAIVMLFCTITFFRKFAMVLFLTVIMATISSFVFFVTLVNCFGPTNPTYLMDKCLSTYCGSDIEYNAANAKKEDRCLTAAKVTCVDS